MHYTYIVLVRESIRQAHRKKEILSTTLYVMWYIRNFLPPTKQFSVVPVLVVIIIISPKKPWLCGAVLIFFIRAQWQTYYSKVRKCINFLLGFHSWTIGQVVATCFRFSSCRVRLKLSSWCFKKVGLLLDTFLGNLSISFHFIPLEKVTLIVEVKVT